jgi:hypothetical protein
MSLPDDFLDLSQTKEGWWKADVKFMEGTARGSGIDEIEAMQAARDDLDLIARDLASKRSMLDDLINKAVRDLERYNAKREREP